MHEFEEKSCIDQGCDALYHGYFRELSKDFPVFIVKLAQMQATNLSSILGSAGLVSVYISIIYP